MNTSISTTTALSPRQIEVLQHVAAGQTNQQIAQALQISDQTVKNHLGDVRKTLKVRSRTAAVVFALREGWIVFPEMVPIAAPSPPESTGVSAPEQAPEKEGDA